MKLISLLSTLDRLSKQGIIINLQVINIKTMRSFKLKCFIKLASLVVLLTAAMWSNAASAQLKIAVVDFQQIVQSTPQVALIEQSINAEFADQIQEVKTLQSDGQYLVQKLEREKATMSEAQITELQAEITQKSTELQQKAQPLQQNMQLRMQQEQSKVIGLIRQTINNVAAAGKYDLVLTKEVALFSDPSLDITQQVLDEVTKIK